MRILVLDDMEERHKAFGRWYDGDHTVVHVWTAPRACRLLTSEKRFDVAFLDHDLRPEHYYSYLAGAGDEPTDHGTGMQVVNEIVKLPSELRPVQAVVHSWNTDRAHEMVQRLRDVGVRAEYWRFDPSHQPFK
jgi:CheY-like chemotaxis protein